MPTKPVEKKPQTELEPPYGRTRIQQPKRKPFLVVNDAAGNPVFHEGTYLAWDTSTRRYYISPKPVGSSPYVGSTLKEAIWRFKSYVDSLRGEQPTVEYEQRIPALTWQLQNEGITGFDHEPIRMKNGKPFAVRKFPENEAFKFVADAILDNPREAARKLGIPEIERLPALPKRQPSLTLSECLEFWNAKKRTVGEEERRKVKDSWGLFTRIVGVTTLADITQELFDKWVDACWLPYDDGGAAKTLHHRIGHISRVLRYVAEKKGLDAENCERLLAWIKRLELPSQTRRDEQ